MEAMTVYLDSAGLDLGIQYRAHVQNIGLENTWHTSGQQAGTTGQALRMEAVQMQLTGADAVNYNLYFRVHVQNIGWMGWAVATGGNSAIAGTSGASYRIEAIQIELVKAGDAAPSADGQITSAAYLPVDDFNYQAHVQNIGWQNPVCSGQTAGTTGRSLRVEALHISTNSPSVIGFQYRAQIQNIGWKNTWHNTGDFSGTTGRGLRMEAVQIRLTGEISRFFDVYYRVHVQNYGWMGWAKNGESAGSNGQSLRLEGIQIMLVSKYAAAPRSVAKPFIKSPEDILQSINTASGNASISTFGGFTLSYGARQTLQNGINTAQASGHHAGFIMVDLGTGKGVQYGCDNTFFSMSTMKGPYVISLAAYNPGAIRSNMNTVRSILVYSDNDAYASLWNRYGTGSMRTWMTRAGVNTSRANTKYTYITPRELGKLWILNFQYYNSGELGGTLGALSESPNFSPIHDRLGGKYTTRTKAGWYYRHAGLMNVNDAGIVYSTSGPYMLCVMTDWTAEDKSRLYGIIDALERVHNEM